MLNPLGVMQGRLLPQYKGRYQAHPFGYWQNEFHYAANLGLDCIEYILDFENAVSNPLLTKKGRNEIKSYVARTGVKVISICADYFMEAPLHAEDNKQVEKSLSILKQLINASVEIGVKNIVIPCVDQSSIKKVYFRDRFQEVLTEIIPVTEKNCVNLSLETDLSPSKFAELLNKIDSKYVTVNYDIGNSASHGYDPVEETAAYGERISDIHIKDRVFGGGSVKLGNGDADIPGFFKLLEVLDYRGPFIMQAYRDIEGVNIFTEQLKYIRGHELWR